jgi:NTE family protein
MWRGGETEVSTDSSLAPTVSLALGGGGARGYAHIGVIQVLLERGYKVVAVSGSSMGALVGGMHAAGTLPAFTGWALTLSRPQVMRLLRPSRATSGPFTADKVLDRMSEMVGSVQIQDLAIPFTAVATDLLARKPVWFQQGSLELAIRASIAIPGFFTPVVLDGRVLVDGGVIDPVPMTPLASVRSDITIAVTLSGYPAESMSDVARSGGEESSRAAHVRRVPSGPVSLLDRDAASSAREPIAGDPRPDTSVGSLTGRDVSGVGDSDESVDLKALEIVNLSYETMSNVITRYRLAGYPPDVIVSVPRDACGLLDFHRAADMIDLGRRLAEATLDRVSSVPHRGSG